MPLAYTYTDCVLPQKMWRETGYKVQENKITTNFGNLTFIRCLEFVKFRIPQAESVWIFINERGGGTYKLRQNAD